MIKLIGSLGGINDPVMLNVRGSGTIWPNSVVVFSQTGGAGVSQASGTTTSTAVFGVALDYSQGASDTQVRVIPFTPSQLWSADAYNAVTTAQIGLRHILRTTGTDAMGRFVENTATDAATAVGVFHCLAIDTVTGTGRLIGRFLANTNSWYPSQTTTSQ